MNCRRIQGLIPLYVEGDLKAGKAAHVRSHLEECPECERVSSEYRASQQWLRSYTPPDFGEDFFDGLRGGVLSEIEAGRSRRSRFSLFGPRLALSPAPLALASLVVFAAFVGLALYSYPGMKNDEAPPYLRGGAGAARVPGIDDRAPSDIDWRLSDATPRSPRPAPKLGAARGPGHERQRRAALATLGGRPAPEPFAPAAVGGEPSEKVLRIELQTGDPNIRIIWFAPPESNAEGSKLIINTETE